MVTVLTMYTDANPDRAMTLLRALRARRSRRGREVYIHANCQPLSFDFTLREPYLLHGARRLRPRQGGANRRTLPGIYADPAFRARLPREPAERRSPGVLFSGDWSKVEVGSGRADPR